MTAAAARILLVECDPARAAALSGQLSADGYRVELARTAEHARVLAHATDPTVALLGGLPSAEGPLELLREVRPASSGRPPRSTLAAIVLGQEAHELDLLRAFDAGAEDYLAPTAGYIELRARLQALLRRLDSGSRAGRSLEVGSRSLVIDVGRRSVALAGLPVELRRLEFELLSHLAAEPERVFTRQELLRGVWGYRSNCSTRTVDSHASRLRRRLDPKRPERWVVNVRGVGYRLI